MPPTRSAHAAKAGRDPDEDGSCIEGEIIAFDDLARRRARLAAYADQTRPVIVYRFVLPHGALVPALGCGEPRDAGDQLQLMVGLIGGAVTRGHDGLTVRIPRTLAARFEAMAGPLIAAYLVALDLGWSTGQAT